MLTEQERAVLSRIDAEDLVERTRQLVRVPSVYRPTIGMGEEAAARLAKDWLDEAGLETHWEVVAPGRPNVIGVLRGPEDGRYLLLEGHTDVVTEGDASAWRHPPFAAQVENGRIYGRGSADMKGGLVAAIAALRALAESRIRLGGTIAVAALVDEEARMLGVKAFVGKGWARGISAAIICEPEDNRLCVAQKGVMWARVTLNGKMAHGAMPYAGVNPILQGTALLHELEMLEAEQVARYGEHPLLGRPSISPTIIQSPLFGEAQNNVIPAHCSLTLDIRLIPGQSPEALAGEMRAILRRLSEADPTFKADLEVIESRPPTETPRDEPVVTCLAGAYKDLSGLEPVFGGVPGSTDGTILSAHAGIPVVTCGPGATEAPHQVDEYLDVEQLTVAARLYALTAMRYLGVLAGGAS